MEPRAQNAHLLPFFYYDTIKLTKNDYFYPFCTKSMEQCSKKVLFFSPENGPNEVSPISSSFTLLDSQ